jgi:dynein heavy chain
MPTGGGRNPITARYARHFSTISITDFNDATLRRIFCTILNWAFSRQPFPANIKVGSE